MQCVLMQSSTEVTLNAHTRTGLISANIPGQLTWNQLEILIQSQLNHSVGILYLSETRLK